MKKYWIIVLTALSTSSVFSGEQLPSISSGSLSEEQQIEFEHYRQIIMGHWNNHQSVPQEIEMEPVDTDAPPALTNDIEALVQAPPSYVVSERTHGWKNQVFAITTDVLVTVGVGLAMELGLKSATYGAQPLALCTSIFGPAIPQLTLSAYNYLIIDDQSEGRRFMTNAISGTLGRTAAYLGGLPLSWAISPLSGIGNRSTVPAYLLLNLGFAPTVTGLSDLLGLGVAKCASVF